MVKVYFEQYGHARLRAMFSDETMYELCFAQLASYAERKGYILTESVEEDIELSYLIK